MSTPDPNRGELALLLHSHMPYVEGFGTWPFGEEWLFEAMAGAYMPLIEQCEEWAQAGERQILTIGVTPVLADQLVLGDVAERFVRFVRETRAECHRLDIEGLERAGQADAAEALRRSARDYEHAVDHFEALGRNLPAARRRLCDVGVVDLWASAATHAVLPLVATESAIRLQLATGIESHRARFARWSGGFWLPECAFRSGLEEQLGSAGVRAFCVDQSAWGESLDQLEPVPCEGGAVAVPIDWPTIALVWDERGYPADPIYRDYHASSLNGLRPYANSGRPYVPEAATRRAHEHARDFVERVVDRLDRYRAARGQGGLLVCALDTELLGHWWYEGPQWLSAVVQHARDAGVALTTLPEGLARHEPRSRELHDSSWGDGKDLRTWDSPAVADLVWPARRAELALAGVLPSACNGAGTAAIERAARELLALESSDWQFMETRGLAADYPRRRVRDHAAAFEHALASVCNGVTDSAAMWGDDVEARLRGLAPGLRLSALLEPPSTWGRNPADGARS
jgi:1,4-alpha-glucan branching enzyme